MASIAKNSAPCIDIPEARRHREEKRYPRIGDLLESIHPLTRRHPVPLPEPFRLAVLAVMSALGRVDCACERAILEKLVTAPGAPNPLDADDFVWIAERFFEMGHLFLAPANQVRVGIAPAHEAQAIDESDIEDQSGLDFMTHDQGFLDTKK